MERFVAGRQLREGEIYTLAFVERDENLNKTVIKKRMRLIKCYTHRAQFEDMLGVRHSYIYWDLEKMLRGEPR